MATERRIIECVVCQTRIGTRTLIGFLDRHPILLSCPKCEIDISGELTIDQENGRFSLSFLNTKEVPGDLENADYYAEISGELLTGKMRVLPDGKLPPFVSPMFKALAEMGEENYALYKSRIVNFIDRTKSSWPTLKRINELWAHGQTEYCKGEIRKLLPEDKYPLANDLGVITAIKHLNVNFVAPILPDSFLDDDARIINSLIQSLVDRNGNGLLELAGWLGHANKFNRFRELFVTRVEHFIRAFPHIVPVFSVQYCKGSAATALKSNGLFTGNLSSLSQFYIDTYENLIEMSDGIIGLNNLIHRANFMEVRALRRDVKTLDDYCGLQKGERLRFLINEEDDLGDCLGPYLDNKVRNSIGHGSTRFDPISQRLDFYSGVGQTTPAVTKCLLEFANDCRMMMLGIYRVMEINSWLERVYLMGVGQTPENGHGWK